MQSYYVSISSLANPSSLQERLASVGPNFGTGNQAGCVRNQKADQLGHLFRFALGAPVSGMALSGYSTGCFINPGSCSSYQRCFSWKSSIITLSF
jgi:hypothetical protein